MKQTEFAKKAFDITVQNTRDVAQLATQTTTDASKIIRDRLRESLTELGPACAAPKGNSRKREPTLAEIFTQVNVARGLGDGVGGFAPEHGARVQ